MGNRIRKPQITNAPISVLAKILKMVVASAAEAEIAALFMNAEDLVPLRVTLKELGRPQPPTAIRTDNSTANGIVNGIIKQKKSKAIDMRFYRVRDRVEAGQFVVYWEPGENNLSDYYTKHQPAKRVRRIRHIYMLHYSDINSIHIFFVRLLLGILTLFSYIISIRQNICKSETTAVVAF